MADRSRRQRVEFVPPDAYPQVLPRAQVRAFVQQLMSEDTVSRASRAIAAHSVDLRKAILSYAETLQACGDREQLYATAHEIRGIAETAGLGATGRIADKLCRYLDGAAQAGMPTDPAAVRLHVDAIVRAARAADEAEQLGSAVARELDALASHTLRETPPR